MFKQKQRILVTRQNRMSAVMHVPRLFRSIKARGETRSTQNWMLELIKSCLLRKSVTHYDKSCDLGQRH